ncbi:MAG: class I SAM-dependent methyltransferase [Cycloclasticus sp.]|jgi:SAM-dependent methyltransferase|nr:MAG: methyltransferase type 11 [Cycloclasticus sp. Phe_18]MBV1912851.1 class I SAM-dependent methyltransferase [Cycloclasticus sp.]MDF1688666.1 class I SAM-dependent methyltransferase [Cycloclasticus sp.]MEE4290950.1 class I SAM-dependent methyltransferase [Cycloclasticus sp.]
MADKKNSFIDHSVELRHWFNTPIGQAFRQAESALLSQKLSENFRAEVLQLDFIGWEEEFHEAMRFAHYTILDHDTTDLTKYTRVVAEADSLPIDTHSVDIVIMPHTLEFDENPHQVLREVNRVLKPEGIVLLMGFNPWAFWHLPRFLPTAKRKTPWNGRFISRYRVLDWLKLLNFEIEVSQGCCLFPLFKKDKPIKLPKTFRKVLACIPFVPAAYFVMGVKRVSGGTSVFHLQNLKNRFISPLTEPATKTIHVEKKGADLH